MKTKKDTIFGWLFIAAYVFIAFMLVFSFIPISYKVDRQISGIMWERNMESFSEPVEITVEGRVQEYLFNFFFEDTFTGLFSLSNVAFTKEYSMFPISGLNKNNSLYLSYFNTYDNISLGTLRQSGDFSKGVLLLNNRLFEDREMIVSFPCQTREEAVALADLKFPEFLGFQ